VSKDKEAQNIGLFGGTFDPVHQGHLSVALSVIDRYLLDNVIFIPAAFPPHKQPPAASYVHRVAMLELALAGQPRLSISLLEAERQSPSYTLDTLKELGKRLGQRNFYLIIGADSFSQLHLWYGYTDVLGLTDLIVAARPGFSLNDCRSQVSALPGHYTFDGPHQAWRREDGRRIFYFADTQVRVSSSDIRNQIDRGKSVGKLVPANVLRYIYQHQLYGAQSPTED